MSDAGIHEPRVPRVDGKTPIRAGRPDAPITGPNPMDRSRAFVTPLLWMVAALAPFLFLVAATDWFFSQDGPTQLYNASLFARLIDFREGDASLRAVYAVHWIPFPNWTTTLLLAALKPLGPRAANCAALCISLLGFGGGLIFLRARMGPVRSPATLGIWCAVASVSYVWMLGFVGFLLGAALAFITLGLGLTYLRSDRPGTPVLLGGLLLAVYFCHAFAVLLAVLGIFFLAFFHRRRMPARCALLFLATLPVIALGAFYLWFARAHGNFAPDLWWTDLREIPRQVGRRLAWIDPFSLAGRALLPWNGERAWWAPILSPVLLISAALSIHLLDLRKRLRNPPAEPAVLALGLVCLVWALLGPESLGSGHGHYLGPRAALLGLALLMLVVQPVEGAPRRRAALLLLIGALGVQFLVLRDYAKSCASLTGSLREVDRAIPEGPVGVAFLPGKAGNRFRANPRLHYEEILGLRGRIVWNNYQAGHYYFPVGFRRSRDLALRESLARIGHERMRDEERMRLWSSALELHLDRIDFLVVPAGTPGADLSGRFARLLHGGSVDLYRRIVPPDASGRAGPS